MKCAKCGGEVEEGQAFCTECRAPIPQQPSVQYCTACGAPIEDGQQFCIRCGQPVSQNKADWIRPSPTQQSGKETKGWLPLLIVGISLLAVIAVCAAGFRIAGYLHIQSIIQETQSVILDDYPNVTLKDMLDYYLEDVTWKYLKEEADYDVVYASGGCYYKDQPVTVRFTMWNYKDSENCAIVKFTINGTEMSTEEMASVLTKIYDDYVATYGFAESQVLLEVTEPSLAEPSSEIASASSDVVSSDTASSSAQTVSSSADKANIEDVKPVAALTEAELLKKVESAAGYTAEEHLYVDMDHDGAYELFASFYDAGNGLHNWYCSCDGSICYELSFTNMGGYVSYETIEYENETHAVINTESDTCWLYFCILVKEGDDIRTVCDSRLGNACQLGEQVVVSVDGYDVTYDPAMGFCMGHSYKNTYIYYDGRFYHEYALHGISESDFMALENASEYYPAFSVGENSSIVQSDYYSRDNGYKHIQLGIENLETGEIHYTYYTFVCEGNTIVHSWETEGQLETHMTDVDY